MLKKWVWLVVAVAVSLVVGLKVLTPNHFHTHDDIQIFRTNEFIQCFRDGQLPCRWSRDLGKGYGYPLFIFYPPIIYAIPAIITSLSHISLAFALNLSAYLTFPIAALSMYYLIKVLAKRDDLAAIGSVLFTMLPYHAVNVFVRGVYAENLAWAIAPLLLAEVYLVITEKKQVWTLTTVGALILLTHNISAMILSPILMIWAGGLILSNLGKYGKKVVPLIMAGLLAIGVSAWFLFPAITEKPIVQTESMIFDYYSYLVHFPTIRQIFLSNFWGYGGSSWGVKDDGMSFALGQVQWGLLAIAAVIGAFAQRKKLRSYLTSPIAWSLGVALLVILFLAHPRSTPIWVIITPLQYIQFPWRLVGMAGMLTVALATYLLSKLPKKIGMVIGIVASVAAIFLYGNYFRPEKYDGLVDNDYLNGSLRTLQQQDHLFDYLPKAVNVVPDKIADSLLYMSELPVKQSTKVWQSNRAEIEIESTTTQTITLSIFSYPGWSGELNGKAIQLLPDPKNGLITVAVPAGKSVINLNWKETTPRKIGNAISFVSVGILVLGLASSKRKKS